MSELRVDTIQSLTSSAVDFPTGFSVTGTANVTGNLSVTSTLTATGNITTSGTLTAPTLSVSGTTNLTTANITTATATTVNATNLTVAGVPYSEVGCFAFGSFAIDGDDNVSNTARFGLSNTVTKQDLGSNSFRYGFTFTTTQADANYVPFVTMHPVRASPAGVRFEIENLSTTGFDIKTTFASNRSLDIAVFKDLS